jgi:hypothetical protein
MALPGGHSLAVRRGGCGEIPDVGTCRRMADQVERESGAMEKEQPDYLSYLLRLWRAGVDDRTAWRAGLKSSHTGEEVGFGSLDELFDHLRSEAGLEPASNEQG